MKTYKPSDIKLTGLNHAKATISELLNTQAELVEALKAAVASVPMPTGIGIGAGGLEWRFPAWFEAARAALANAEGRT